MIFVFTHMQYMDMSLIKMKEAMNKDQQEIEKNINWNISMLFNITQTTQKKVSI